ncbi:type III secretion system export apparatus subunit SctV [Candidatus Pantoea multigeneris]|uniref:EscV/YscV/HrcV family type III secretion system export apparatus protein n=1 Tax=Candidatus Pantoea multigeneris TaxID=2608357 RepID=A0ABX0RD52_9GAMM|nr:type III secretion system export apparatus subunit SctV [Pantoea multigeneris]NIF23287.1 EscV/YscV/HrcV family type III secretion system export apparatus protein [Pantoea multigeneris]
MNLFLLKSEAIGPVFCLGIVFMLMMPIPLGLLDVLIAINICMSALLMIVVMYVPKPLYFTSFPGALLLVTMFRLAISISTTRQILLIQDGGNIIAAFGNFAVGGNLAVGLIIFLILTLVNFLVITKGAERVAEVAARFTLDAMPGKQMSIDSDLRNNLINVDQAKEKRQELTTESQLFGAMDGAIKFVKGDAIAGIVILFINLIGGISIGVSQLDISASDAMKIYSVLTIGDGLISQIPALLVALSAGVMTTRVSNASEKKNNNVSQDLVSQLANQPKAWGISALGALVFSLIPGMPAVPFLILALLMMLFSMKSKIYSLIYKLKKPQHVDEVRMDYVDDKTVLNTTEIYLMQFSRVKEGKQETQDLINEIKKLRNSIVADKGVTHPLLNIQYLDSVAEDEFRFLIHEVPLVIASFGNDRIAVQKSDAKIYMQDEEWLEGSERRQEQDYVWVEKSIVDNLPKSLVLTSQNQLILNRMKTAFYKNGYVFFSYEETALILRWLATEKPELAKELQKTLPVSTINKVLQLLASERISIRPVIAIAEALLEHGQYERDCNMLVDMVRIQLKEHICYEYSAEDGLHAWLLTSETEYYLRELMRQTPQEIFFSLEPEQAQVIKNILDQHVKKETVPQVVIIVANDLRQPMRRLVQNDFNHVGIISYAELISDVKLNIYGRLDLQYGNAEE